MICRQCGTAIADKAIVCYRCGAGTLRSGQEAGPRAGPWRRTGPLVGLVLLVLLSLYLGQAGRTASSGRHRVRGGRCRSACSQRWRSWRCASSGAADGRSSPRRSPSRAILCRLRPGRLSDYNFLIRRFTQCCHLYGPLALAACFVWSCVPYLVLWVFADFLHAHPLLTRPRLGVQQSPCAEPAPHSRCLVRDLPVAARQPALQATTSFGPVTLTVQPPTVARSRDSPTALFPSRPPSAARRPRPS